MLASNFPGSSVDENPSANAGEMDSIPGPGRLHVLQSRQACVPHPPSPCTLTTEAHVPRVWAPQQEKPNAQQRVATAHSNKRKPTHSNRDPVQSKIN